MSFADGTVISANSYAAQPARFDEVSEQFEKIYAPLFEELNVKNES